MEKYLKNKKVKMRFKADIEPQEVFLDSLAKKREEEIGISAKKFEVPLSRNILWGFLIFAFILISLLFAKAFQLQVIEGKSFSILAERNKFTIYQIKAERGVIYDKYGNQLVWNKPSFDLLLIKSSLPQTESEKTKILKEISEIINKDFNNLKKEIEESNSSEILISENLDHQTLIILETRIGELTGFRIERNLVRDYREGEDFSQLVGYTGKITAQELRENPEQYSIFDWVGRSGLEKSYEEVLKRNPGKLRIEKDAFSNIISKEVISLPESGKSLFLWLDSELQKKIKEELEKQLDLVGSKKAVAIALDPKTGGVLALVSLPSFDNNLFNKGTDPEVLKKLLENPQEPLFNRAISGRYLTGSTIKPLIASAALEEKIISPEKKIYASGLIEVPHQYNPEIIYQFKDWAVHGWTDLRKAIAQSVNVYFYTIGGGYGDQEGLGPTRIKRYLELFGWGKITGIDLPGETTGFIPDKEWKKRVLLEGWWDGDTYYLSIGQQYLQITPLEVVTAFSAIANGGKLLQPQVVQKIVEGSARTSSEPQSNSSPQVVEEIKPTIIRENFIKPENLQIVREGMRQAVTGVNSPLASALSLNSLPVSSAAKTGTAETGNDRYHHWVTVFAPYEDPQIVLTIMIENVKGLQAAALPVAKNVLEWYFSK